MKASKYISVLLVLAMATVFANAQDLQTLGQQDIIGTARYVSMAGAMSAIGNDASAVHDNPASLGTYDHLDAQISLDVQWNNATLRGATMLNDTRSYLMPSSASFVYVTNPVTRKVARKKDELTVVMADEEVMRHAFYFGYRRMKNFRLYSKSAVANPPYPNRMYSTTTFDSEEYGYVNDFALTWAMSWRNRVFVGAGFDVYEYRYQKLIIHDRSYFDANSYDYNNLPVTSYDYDYTEQNTQMKGLGVGGRIGVMGRPVNWMTLALSVSTPTAGKLKVNQQQTMDQYYDSITPANTHVSAWYYGIDYGKVSYTRKFSMPLRVTSGLAFNILNYAQIGLQYDYAHLSGMNDIHSMRVGVEGRPVSFITLNLGYAYTSTFKEPLRFESYDDGTTNLQSIMDNITPVSEDERNQYGRRDCDYHYTNATHTVGAGIGYDGKNVGVQFAYQFNRSYYDLLPEDGMLLYQDGDPCLYPDMPHDMQATTHRIVLTFSFLR